MSLLSIITIGLAGLGGLVNGQRDLSVELGVASNFAILAKAGISSVPDSAILGDIGVSPAAATCTSSFAIDFTTLIYLVQTSLASVSPRVRSSIAVGLTTRR